MLVYTMRGGEGGGSREGVDHIYTMRGGRGRGRKGGKRAYNLRGTCI